MIRLRQPGADEVLIKRVRDWYDPGPGCFFSGVTGVASFDPASLFTTGVNGVWYDPSDFSTLFQDAAGTTPVTAVEQPVGRMLDKSGRGNHAFNSSGNSANFPVLSARYNLYVNTETLATQNVTTVATSYKLTFTGSGSITLTGTTTGVYTAGSYTISCTAGTLTSTVLGTVTQADLRATNDAINQPAYQRVNTSSDYDTVGFKPYLRFNDPARGTNNWLQTNSINFTYGDKMFVCAGVRKLSDAQPAVVAELSAAWYNNSGSFILFNGYNLGSGPYWTYASQGTVLPTNAISPNTYASPVTNVLSGISSISTDTLKLRANGVEIANSTGNQGAGNFGNYPLYIGARDGSSLWFNGRLHQLIVAGKQASAAEITNTETFINQKTGAY